MKVTIIRDDNKVYVDEEARDVDCSDLPEYVSAIQWNGVDGHIEFKSDSYGRRHPNIKIVELKPFQYLIDRHQLLGYKLELEQMKKEDERRKKLEALQAMKRVPTIEEVRNGKSTKQEDQVS